MDKSLRNTLRNVVTQCRKVLEEAVAEVLEGQFGIYTSGKIEDASRMGHLSSDDLEYREQLLIHLQHIQAAGFKVKDAVEQLVREVAFTHLNRFCAYKMMETRGLIRKAVSDGLKSQGFLFYVADNPEEENRRQSQLPVDSLIALAQLRQERRLDTNTLAQAIQRDEAIARSVLERLVEAGLVEAHGVKKGRTYTLSSRIYRELGQPADYVRQAGFDSIQQEQMVLNYVNTHGKITRQETMELCRISEDQATHLLRKLNSIKQLKLVGKGRSAHYIKL